MLTITSLPEYPNPNMIYYAIRKKGTNLFLPTGRKRGFTHDELTFTKPPRLFLKERSAKDALRWWLSGKWTVKNWEDGDEDWRVEKVSDRIKDDMEVVKLRLIIE